MDSESARPSPSGPDERIGETIIRALRASSGTPDAADLIDLEAQLHGHIARLIPSAREAVDRLWHGDTDWHLQVTRLDAIERQLDEHAGGRTGTGTLDHVRILVRDCQWLYAVRLAAQGGPHRS